jgi:lysine biosynthesis protein LysW
MQCTICDREMPSEGHVEVGLIVDCPACGAELEVISTSPPGVAIAFPDQVDWEE